MTEAEEDVDVDENEPIDAGVREEARPGFVWMAGAALLTLATVVSWAMHKQLGQFLNGLDQEALTQAGQLLDRTIEEQRTHLLSEVTVLADDTRVRSSMMTPEFNEATVKDVLQDLQKASGASVMAILDPSGRVQAVTGADGLRGLDLGSSPVISQAREKPSSNVWTFPNQVLVVGVAPIRSGNQVAALFLMGFDLGNVTLGSIERAIGVSGGVVIRDKVTATSSNDPQLGETIKTASLLEDNRNDVVSTDRNYLVRITRTSNSAGAGRVVWLVPRHHDANGIGSLRLFVWIPMLLVALTFALVLFLTGRRYKIVTT
jgi:hypothetical protein